MNAEQLRFKGSLPMLKTGLERNKFCRDGAHDNLNPLGSCDYVGVGDDVAAGVNNHARSNTTLTGNYALTVLRFAGGTETAYRNLHHRRQDPLGHILQSLIELAQIFGGSNRPKIWASSIRLWRM